MSILAAAMHFAKVARVMGEVGRDLGLTLVAAAIVLLVRRRRRRAAP